MRTYQKVKTIPKILLIKKKNGKVKIKCDECNKLSRTRFVTRFKGKFLCANCRMKLPSSRLIDSFAKINHYTLEEALNKVYEVKGYLNKANNGIQAHLNPPSILIGHKIKFLLVK